MGRVTETATALLGTGDFPFSLHAAEKPFMLSYEETFLGNVVRGNGVLHGVWGREPATPLGARRLSQWLRLVTALVLRKNGCPLPDAFEMRSTAASPTNRLLVSTVVDHRTVWPLSPSNMGNWYRRLLTSSWAQGP